MRQARRFPVAVAVAVAVLAAAFAVTLVGCGGGGSTPATQPGSRVNSAVAANFDALPRYPGARPASNRVENPNGVLTQSFTVHGAEPRAILSFFAGALQREGWDAASTGAQQTTPAKRAVWKQNDQTLVVSSAPAPTSESEVAADGVTSQYSFVLYPPGVTPG